jgi:hypothetical protein
MKLRDFSIPIIIIIVGIVTVVGIISTTFMGEDNPVEEVSESVIKQETGLDVDLSPSTPDPDHN